MLSDEEDDLVDFLEARYACHTLILYGSRARGTAHAESDWDVLGISQLSGQRWHHGIVDKLGEVNAYIYNTEMAVLDRNKLSPLFQPMNHFVRLRHGRVLVQENGLGDQLIAHAQDIYRNGLPKASKAQIEQCRHYYLHYGIGNLRKDSLAPALRDYIRHEILSQALPVYFTLRGSWPPSPKDAIAFWQKTRPELYALFIRAVQPDASIDEMEAFLLQLLAVEE
jgi:uncharacterized protein